MISMPRLSRLNALLARMSRPRLDGWNAEMTPPVDPMPEAVLRKARLQA